ncbi:MAG: hypothetical protein Q9165_000109 [Trypethelium subeluteriae]
MASDWNQNDGDLDAFESILSENPTFDDQNFNDELLDLVSQTTELSPEPLAPSTTPASYPDQSSRLPPSQTIQPHSTVSSLSPESSAHDSSSDSSGRRKRKTSSTSSPTFWPNMSSHMNSLKVSDRRQDQGMSMSQTPKGMMDQNFGPSPSASFPLTNNIDYSDKSMAGFFDIDSAAASPGAFGTTNDMGNVIGSDSAMVPPDSKKRRSGLPQKSPPMTNNPSTFFLESRDQSPLEGAMGMNRSVATAMMFNPGQSPPDPYSLDSTWTGPPNNLWNSNNYGLEPINFSPSPVVNNPPLQQADPAQGTNPVAPQLYVDPTTRKSRVETQIPIKLTLSPLPEGISKLHLPTHTIAKPKMLAKEVKRAPDTLELQVMLVCASAMKNDNAKQRAFRLAAGIEQRIKKENPSSNRSSPQQGDTDDDPDKPLNGGEVRICKNCINREAKRAARKKIKSPDDESQWRQYENDRVVVFNTHEYKDWKPWEPTKAENTMDAPSQQQSIPEGSMMVEVPMRIACYCRHQGEKDGFQYVFLKKNVQNIQCLTSDRIIFTIKDSGDHLIAQNISESILITDDHKTQPGSAMPDSSSSYVNLPSAGYVSSDQVNQLSRGYHSTPDLLGLQQQQQQQQQQPSFLPQQRLYHTSRLPSRTTSATETPKNLSRPASPDGSSSGPNKKRKGSGPSSNRYSGLMMTPMTINTAHQALPTSMPNSAGPIGATPPNQFSSFSPQRFTFPQTTEGASIDGTFLQQAGSSYFSTEPSSSRTNTRNGSFSNSFYSAPGSQMPSRASSPVSHRPNQSYQNTLAQRVHANFNPPPSSAIASPTETTQPHAPPMIHKLSPAEGPVGGNTEVSIYGSGFYPGLDVMFGPTPAISTTFWGEKALLCVLPPSPHPGPVNVTFSGLMQSTFPPPPSQPSIFTYRDENKEKRDLLDLFKKMIDQGGATDKYMEHMQSFIPGSSAAYQGAGAGPHGGMPHSYNRSHAVTVGAMLGSSDTEGAILKFLELGDQEIGRLADVDLKLKDGSTLLSTACSMGHARAVATLLARRANPDTRDANGVTPLGIAAMRGHTHIIHLLLRKGADPSLRTLRGHTAADLASSEEVRLALVHTPHHSRNSSGLRSLKSGRSSPDVRSLNSFYTTTDESGFSSEEETKSHGSGKMLIHCQKGDRLPSQPHSRPLSRHPSRRNSVEISPTLGPSTSTGCDQQTLNSPYAAMIAWRDSLSAQIQHFQESMQRNLPNFPNWQLPTLPPMPNLPDYQDHPMMRRISSLVPNRHLSQSPTSSSDVSSSRTQRPSEVQHGFWDFFSSAPLPPAYEDLYPELQDRPFLSDKKAATVEAMAEAVLDETCERRFDGGTGATSAGRVSPAIVTPTSHGGKIDTHQEQYRLKLGHAQKPQKDNKLYCFWVSLLAGSAGNNTSTRRAN